MKITRQQLFSLHFSLFIAHSTHESPKVCHFDPNSGFFIRLIFVFIRLIFVWERLTFEFIRLIFVWERLIFEFIRLIFVRERLTFARIRLTFILPALYRNLLLHLSNAVALLLHPFFLAERGAVFSCRSEHFKRRHETGFDRKNSTGIGQRRIPAYFEMNAFAAIGEFLVCTGGVRHGCYTAILNTAPISGVCGG